jgi:hypothetical protein
MGGAAAATKALEFGSFGSEEEVEFLTASEVRNSESSTLGSSGKPLRNLSLSSQV